MPTPETTSPRNPAPIPRAVATLALLGVLIVPSADALVWRADLKEVGKDATGEMKQAGKVFYSPLRVFGGSCVALGGNWVLTCRHGIEKWSSTGLAVQFPFLDKTVYQIEKVLLCDHGDFALLRTRKAVEGAAVIELYDGDEETDSRAWIGSYGLSGPTGKTAGVGKFHTGHNRIDRIRNGKLTITLSRPDDPKAEKTEATLAVFDSGSPLFIKPDDLWQLAGIASTASNSSNPGYGDRGNYARVSAVRPWIEKIIASP